MDLKFKPHQAGESWESMRARFPKAIETVMTSGDDPRCIDNRHIFDFDDDWRMHVARDRPPGKEVIGVTFGDYNGTPYPVDLLIAKAMVHFAELTDDRYGNPVHIQHNPPMVFLAYDVAACVPS